MTKLELGDFRQPYQICGGGDVPRKKLVVWPPLGKFGLIKSIELALRMTWDGKTTLPKDDYMSIVNTKYFQKLFWS